MVHNALSPHAPAVPGRTHVPMTVDALMTRGDFQLVKPDERQALGITWTNGDQLMIRRIGYFAVRVYLPYRKGRALVWVALHNGTQFVWKAPQPHPSNYLAALDAFKLTEALTFTRVGGD
jgi:hypothetical protein